jgi:hypothetical protein
MLAKLFYIELFSIIKNDDNLNNINDIESGKFFRDKK